MEIIKNTKPSKMHHLTKYPFETMELNDCVKIKKNADEDSDTFKKRATSIRSSADAFVKRRKVDWKFQLRTHLDFILLYRIQ